MTEIRLAHDYLNIVRPELRTSDRGFGFVFVVFCSLVAGWRWLHAAPGWPWWLAVAIVLLAAALLKPIILRPFNRAWYRFGLLLHRLVSPVAMALLFFTAVLPTALVMRMLGKDVLKLRRDPAAASYWVMREPMPEASAGMRRQF